MTTIAITGADGVIGTVLRSRLGERYDLRPLDLPTVDARDLVALEPHFSTVDVVVHLAGVFGPPEKRGESWRSPHRHPDNMAMFHAALRAAHDAGVRQFVHASSIHVEDTVGHLRRGGPPLRAIPGHFVTAPASGYGASKREQEELLAAEATEFADGAVSVRFGGVRPAGVTPRSFPDPLLAEHEARVHLRHADLETLMVALIERPSSRRYEVLHAVSDNPGRFHDVTNSFGWRPGA